MEPVPARPITAMFMGLIVGLCVAVLLQQAGVWPLDKLTTFLLPGLLALIFVLLSRLRRVATPMALAIALILLIPPVVYGVTGIGEIGSSGELNGGCAVDAASDVDTTIVTDTSRSSPFDIDPDGGLSWLASSPGPITDHEWEIWVVIGGFEYVVADGAEENSDLTTTNEGDEPDVRAYVEDLGFRAGDQIQGVYEVGGFIDGEGGACDGFGFVRIEGPFLGTIASWVALVVALIALGIFSLIAFTSRQRPIAGGGETGDEGRDKIVVTAAGGAGTVGTGGGRHTAPGATSDERIIDPGDGDNQAPESDST
jgi:hypothetical protein